MVILVELSSAQLTEIMYIICRILYDTKAQQLGMPHYIPGPYRNKDLTISMCLEKIWYLSPAAHFVILRDLSFFAKDNLGIRKEFYEIVLVAAKGENPEDAVQAARTNYLEFSFSGGDLRDKLGKGGAKEGVKSTKPRDPVPPKDCQPMETDQEVTIIDLRDRITGKQAPAKVELTTKLKAVSKPAYTDVRYKDKKEVERNAKALTDKKNLRKKNAHNHHPWTGPGPSSSSKQKTDSSKPPPQPGARKASADHSPGRRGSKRERSPTDTSCISEENRSPPRRRRSRLPSPSRSPSLSPSPRRRRTVRSTKGKGDRLSYSRSPSPRHSRRKERLPERKPHSSIPGLSRQGKCSNTRLTGRAFSTRRRSSSPPTPPPRRTRSPAPPSRSPSWQDVRRSDKGRRRYRK